MAKKKCPVCGLIQDIALDCVSCATSLINTPAIEESSGEWLAPEPEATPASQQASPGVKSTLVSGTPPAKSAATPASGLCLQVKPGCLIKLKDGDVIGRTSVGSEFLKDYEKVSRRHAKVKYEGGQWIIEDQNSANGLLLEGVKVDRIVLELGTEFSISLSCELTVVAC